MSAHLKIEWLTAWGPFKCKRWVSKCGRFQVLQAPEGVAWAHDLVYRNSSSVHEAMLEAENWLNTQPVEEWECPIGQPDCRQNCGDYGCGN